MKRLVLPLLLALATSSASADVRVRDDESMAKAARINAQLAVAYLKQNDVVAARVNDTMGKRVALTYKQHKGIPTSCFGETEYFVVGAKAVE